MEFVSNLMGKRGKGERGVEEGRPEKERDGGRGSRKETKKPAKEREEIQA